MRTTYSTLRCNLRVLLLFAAMPLTAQAALQEWPLPAGSLSRQIDASSPSGLVYFVDQALLTINQLDTVASTLTQWPAPFSPTVPGGIVVDQLSAPQFVYVTDLPANTLGQLDIINNIYNRYNLTLLPFNIQGGPRQLVYDTSHMLEPDDLVWFCASGSSATGASPLIGYFDSVTFKFRVWFLPFSVAFPGESIDGLAVNMIPGAPTVYFAVNGFAHNNIAALSPFANSVTFWPLPAAYTQPAPIVATNAGEVFRVRCTGCNTLARVRTAANMLDEWSSPIDNTDMFLTLDPAALVPRFTGRLGGAPTADMLLQTCSSNTSPLVPNIDFAMTYFYYLSPERIPVQPVILPEAPVVSNLDTNPTCPFLRWLPISSDGPISMDTAGGTWISETNAQFIANF